MLDKGELWECVDISVLFTLYFCLVLRGKYRKNTVFISIYSQFIVNDLIFLPLNFVYIQTNILADFFKVFNKFSSV